MFNFIHPLHKASRGFVHRLKLAGNHAAHGKTLRSMPLFLGFTHPANWHPNRLINQTCIKSAVLYSSHLPHIPKYKKGFS